MQKPTIEAIIWDFGQVAFFFPNNGWLRPWSKVLRVKEAIASSDSGKIEVSLAEAQSQFETGKTTADGHRLALSSAFGLSTPLTWEEFRFGYLMSETLELNTPLFDAQATIGKIGLAQAVISNLCPIWHQVLERAGATRHLDEELYSYSEGIAKPSEELIVRAIDRLGVMAENVLVVDDSLENLATAAFCGTKIHRYSGNDRLADRLAELNLPPQCCEPLLTKKPEPFIPTWR